MMFKVEQATPDLSEAFVPFYASLMADQLRARDTDLEHPDLPVFTLIECGFSTPAIAKCFVHAIRMAKEDARHAALQQQLIP